MQQFILGWRQMADAMAGDRIAQQVIFAVNRYKLESEKQKKGNSAMREVIVGGQYQCLHSEIVIPQLGRHEQPDKTPHRDLRFSGFGPLAQACNQYYRPKLRKLLQLLGERSYANPTWLAGLQRLLDGELGQALDNNRAMLLRVGRHSHAENMTLDGARLISIPQRNLKNQDTNFTVWLAASESDADSDMLPFGWVLVEPAHMPPLPQQQQWCATQHKAGSMVSVREKIAAQREQLQTRRAAEQQAQAEAAARAQAEAQAQAAAEQARAAMSEATRATADFLAKWDAAPNKGPGQPAFVARAGMFRSFLNASIKATGVGGNYSDSFSTRTTRPMWGAGVQVRSWGSVIRLEYESYQDVGRQEDVFDGSQVNMVTLSSQFSF